MGHRRQEARAVAVGARIDRVRRSSALFAILVGLGGLLYLLWSYNTVADLSIRAETLDVGENQACAVERGGTVTCWGSPISSVRDDQERGFWRKEGPVRVKGLSDVVDVAVGLDGLIACAVDSSEQVYCWGWIGVFVPSNQLDDMRDQLDSSAYAPVASAAEPVPVAGLSDVVELFGGGNICARHSDDTISCGGASDVDGLGVGGFALIPGLDGARSVHTAFDSWCGLLDDASVRCIGRQDPSFADTVHTNVAWFQGTDHFSSSDRRQCVVSMSGETECTRTCDAQRCIAAELMSKRFTGATQLIGPHDEFCGVFAGELRCLKAQSEEFIDRSSLGSIVAGGSSGTRACVANQAGQVHCWPGGSRTRDSWAAPFFGEPTDALQVVPVSFVPLRQRLVWLGLFASFLIFGLWINRTSPTPPADESPETDP